MHEPRAGQAEAMHEEGKPGARSGLANAGRATIYQTIAAIRHT
jgi:hypothetical protein